MVLKEFKFNENLENKLKTREKYINLKELLGSSKYKDKIIKDLSFSENEKELKVIGSHELIEKVLEFEKSMKKEDFNLELKDTCFKSFCQPNEEKKEKISEFEMEILIDEETNKKLKGESYYVVKKDYNELLEIKSLYDGCSNKETKYEDKILTELKNSYLKTYKRNKEILGSLKNKKRKYRFITVNGRKYIRAIRGENYKDYNNLVALYFGLYVFDKIARENKQTFKIERVNYTDSKFKISLSRKDDIKKEIEDVFLGIDLYNNELGEGSVILAISYYLRNGDKKINLNPNTDNNISHKILSIPHTVNIEKAIERVTDGIKDMKEFEEELLEISEKIRNNKLTEQFINSIINPILKAKRLENSTKDKVEKMTQTIKLTLELASFLGKLNDLDIEFEEQEYINYLCYKALKGWNIKPENK